MMVKITINNKNIEVRAGQKIIEICDEQNIKIPRFCYHKKLEIAGNCRMCLVEIEKMPKLAASCATIVTEGMVIHTTSEKVKEARANVMEFLLINHPLDCPICDQGGECSLQDQAMAYGRGISRFTEDKRIVKDKDFGPFIETHMTRCIHCTRCVRFAEDIAGIQELGGMYRGEDLEIGTFIEKAIVSELSGNMIDLCPVGALNAKPSAYKIRSWELKHIKAIDVLDAVGSNIRLDISPSDNKIMRILPRENNNINECWISDKTRFFYDSLSLQRLDSPMIRKNGKLEKISWDAALDFIIDKITHIPTNRIGFLLGPILSLETIFAFKKLLTKISCSNHDYKNYKTNVYFNNRSQYLFNTKIIDLENIDFCLLIGANPRYEATTIGMRLRKAFLKNNAKFYSIGEMDEQNHPVEILSDDIAYITKLFKKDSEFTEILKNAKKPIFIIGENILLHKDASQILDLIHNLAMKYDIQVNFLNKNITNIAAKEIGIAPVEGNMDAIEMLDAATRGNLELLYIIAQDEVNLDNIDKDCLVIYQGHHGDKVANKAHLILPMTSFAEESATYINIEGRIQRSEKALEKIPNSLEAWEIVAKILFRLENLVYFADIDDLRNLMLQEYPQLSGEFLEIENFFPYKNIHKEEDSKENRFEGKISSRVANFYMTDSMTRLSKNMAKRTLMDGESIQNHASVL